MFGNLLNYVLGVIVTLGLAVAVPTGLYAQDQDGGPVPLFDTMVGQETVLAGFATCTSEAAANQLGRERATVTKGNCYGIDHFVNLVIEEILYSNGQTCGLFAVLRVHYPYPLQLGPEVGLTQFMVVVDQDLGPFCNA